MPRTRTTKKPVAERALVARINRALAQETQQLMRCSHRSRWYSELGAYYIVDQRSNRIVAQHCALEPLARECGVLAPYEALTDVE